jgi:hypothetical protein
MMAFLNKLFIAGFYTQFGGHVFNTVAIPLRFWGKILLLALE